MAETIHHAPVHVPVIITYGGAGLVVAASTAVAADHSVENALIVAVSGVAAVVIGPLVSAWARNRHRPADHKDEVIAEQRDLLDHYLAELVELRADNKDLDSEIKRLKRHRAD